MLDRDQFGSKKAFETATRHRITEAHLAVIRPQQAAVGYSTFDVRAAMKARANAKGAPKGKRFGLVERSVGDAARVCLSCGASHHPRKRCLPNGHPATMTPGLPPGIDPEDVPS